MDYTSFDEFEAILYKLSESTKYPTKQDAPLLSPAIYQPDTTRANDNVVGWAGFGILDIDDYPCLFFNWASVRNLAELDLLSV